MAGSGFCQIEAPQLRFSLGKSSCAGQQNTTTSFFKRLDGAKSNRADFLDGNTLSILFILSSCLPVFFFLTYSLLGCLLAFPFVAACFLFAHFTCLLFHYLFYSFPLSYFLSFFLSFNRFSFSIFCMLVGLLVPPQS